MRPASLKLATGRSRAGMPAAANHCSHSGTSPSSGSSSSAAAPRPSRRRAVAGAATAIQEDSANFSAMRPGHSPRPERTAAWKPSRGRSTTRWDASSSSVMSGWRARQRPSLGSSQRCANEGSTATRRRCSVPAAARDAACTPASSCASAVSVLASKACPAALSTMRRPRRSKSVNPSCSSSSLICWLTAAGVTCRASAASANDRRDPTASKTRSAFSGRRA